MADETPQERFIHLVESEPGKFQVNSNIPGWEQHIKAMAASIRDTEVKHTLGIVER